MSTALASRRRPLRTAAATAFAVITMLNSACTSIFVQAQGEFTGVGSSYAFRDATAVNCGSGASSASNLSYVAVNSAHFAANRACGYCVQVRWRWCSDSEPNCRWSPPNATATLRVSGQCVDCDAGDLSFSADVYSRVVATRDAGDLQDPVEIKWQFTDCPAQQQPETDSHTPTPSPSLSPSPFSTATPAPTGNSTAHTNTSSPSLSHNSSSTSTVSPSPSPTSTPAATNASTRVPFNASTPTPASTPYTQVPSSYNNNNSTSSSNSTGSTGCSTPEAGSLTDTNHQLKCNESASTTTTTAPVPPTSTIPAASSPSPVASEAPPVPSASGDDDTTSIPGSVVIVEAKSSAVTTSKSSSTSVTDAISSTRISSASTKIITRATGDSNDDATAPVHRTSDKSTQFRAVSSTTDANAEPAPPSEAPSAPKKKASTPGVDDEEVYAPSSSGSSTSDSKTKRRSNNDASAQSNRTSDDSTAAGRTSSEKLLKNPFFFSSMLLAVVGFVGAVVAYRAKERKQHRHAHQQVAWRQYSQRVQSASTRPALGTPSPGGGGSNMGDAYIVSSTTRHAASSSPAVAAAVAALSPTPFGSMTPHAKLGPL